MLRGSTIQASQLAKSEAEVGSYGYTAIAEREPESVRSQRGRIAERGGQR